MSDEKPDQNLEKLVGHLRERRTLVEELIDQADAVCKKLESPTASVTIFDQAALRKAI